LVQRFHALNDPPGKIRALYRNLDLFFTAESSKTTQTATMLFPSFI